MTEKRQFMHIQSSQGKKQTVPLTGSLEPSPQEPQVPISQFSPALKPKIKQGSGLLTAYGAKNTTKAYGPHSVSRPAPLAQEYSPLQQPVTDPLDHRISARPIPPQHSPVRPGQPSRLPGASPYIPQQVSPVQQAPRPQSPVQPVAYQSNSGAPGIYRVASPSAPLPAFSGGASMADIPPRNAPVSFVGAPGVSPFPRAPYANPAAYAAPPDAAFYSAHASTQRPPQGPPPRHKKRRFPIWARVTTGVLLFFLIVLGCGFGYYQIEIAPSLNNIIGQKATHHNFDGSIQNNQNTTPNTPLSGQNRINILLLGSDTDGKGNDGTNGSPLAQTDIVITIDQQKHTVGMLSIPRDLQISVGDRHGKMDFAFSWGWQEGQGAFKDKAASAAGLAEDAIKQNYGIQIDRYAWVGLQGFVKVITTAGGVDVDVTHPMVDDTYPDDVTNPNGSVYDYKRLYIAPGPQHLDGPQSLEYVRTRHSDLVGDFGRSARQQQLLSALKTKLATPDTIGKIPDLLRDLSGSVLTDMDLNDLIFLGNLARNIDPNGVQHVTLSPPYSYPSAVPGDSNYLPNCDQIQPIISQMFDITANCIPQPDDQGYALGTYPTQLAIHTGTTSFPTKNTYETQAMTLLGNQTVDMQQAFNPLQTVEGIHTLLDILFMTACESFNAVIV